MNVHDLLEALRQETVITLSDERLQGLLKSVEILRDEDTCLSGRIRILSVDGNVLLQGQTPEGKILLRKMASVDEAERFLEDRLATYERMWDGCGCKVDYDR